MTYIDLTVEFPRSPRDRLDGMDILARAIDKARAELYNKLGEYIYWGCDINRILFTTLGVTDEQFLVAVAKAEVSGNPSDRTFLEDVRESREDIGFLSDEQIMSHVRRAQVDNEIVSWIDAGLKPERFRVSEMNRRFEDMRPDTPQQKKYFADALASAAATRTDIRTFADLLELQEGRLQKFC